MDPIEKIYKESKTIAVVGASDNPKRPSYDVAKYLQAQGFRIIPVNPALTELLGEKSYPDLLAIPEPVDVVDVFRHPDAVPEIVEQAIAHFDHFPATQASDVEPIAGSGILANFLPRTREGAVLLAEHPMAPQQGQGSVNGSPMDPAIEPAGPPMDHPRVATLRIRADRCQNRAPLRSNSYSAS